MPKIRGVKPDYWTDEDIVDLSIPARLLYIGLWNYACDNGHLEDKPKQIKMRLMPGDDVNVSELLRELHDGQRIVRADGWITVPNLGEHQKVDLRYFTTCDKADCVDPPEKVSQREARRAHAVHTSAPTVRTPGARGDGDGDGDGELIGPRKSARRAARLPDDFAPNDTNRKVAADEGVDLDRELTQFKDHHTAKGSTFKDWNLALNTWLRNARQYGSKPVTPPRPKHDPEHPWRDVQWAK